MLKQRNNCRMCVKTTSARQNRKISSAEPSSNKYFLGKEEPGTAWQKSTLKAKLVLEPLEKKLLVTFSCPGAEENPMAVGIAARKSGHGEGSLVTQLQCSARSLPAPPRSRVSLGTSYLGHHLGSGDNNTSCPPGYLGCKCLPTKTVSYVVYQQCVVHGLGLVYRSWSLIIILLIVVMNIVIMQYESNNSSQAALVLFLSELLS